MGQGTMSEPSRGLGRLGDAIRNLLATVPIDEAKVAEIERDNQAAAQVENRRLRRERLRRLDIQLDRSIYSKIVSDVSYREGMSMVAVKRWLHRDDLKPTLVLVGGTGCGKSAAASWAIASWERSSYWVSGPDLVQIFAATYGDEVREQKKIKKTELLVIDDPSTGGNPARECAILIDILNSRKQRRTIITDNLAYASRDESKETWCARYGDPRLHSRLNQQAVFVYDDGPDLRGVT